VVLKVGLLTQQGQSKSLRLGLQSGSSGQHLPRKCEALSSNPSTIKEKPQAENVVMSRFWFLRGDWQKENIVFEGLRDSFRGISS
jgi:hypothetical protein